MKEAQFIKENKAFWQEAEGIAKEHKTIEISKLVETYQEISEDLSYARTYYPNSRVTTYLNSIVDCLYTRINQKSYKRRNKISDFWLIDVPKSMYTARYEMFFILFVFIVSAGIGLISSFGDDSFARLILGDAYVDMTIDNIKSGNPMKVYDSSSEGYMFFNITINNIMVGINCFIYGIFAMIGSIYIIFSNGVLLGAFEGMLYQHGVFSHALSVVFLHGTIELSIIVICGGAGLCLGTGWLFPNTYRRIDSFKMKAITGLKIMISTIPLFIVAGFIESYITRYEHMNMIFKIMIIGISVFIITFYYIYLPYKMRNYDTSRENL